MRVTIDRSRCNHALNECERCLGGFVANPQGTDRVCITEFVDDGDPVLWLALRYDGHEEVLKLDPAERALVLSEGWSRFVKVPPRFYRE